MSSSVNERLGMSMEELKAAHSGRDVMYSLFYRAFIMTPDEDLYAMISDLLPNILAVAEDFEEKVFKEGAAGLAKFKLTRESLSGQELADFDLDNKRNYTQILCLTNSVRVCESHYLSEDKLSRQEPQEQCLALYAKYKMPKDERYQEDEDFISLQMKFMAFMAYTSVKTIDIGDIGILLNHVDEQIKFLEDHPNKWIERFVSEVCTYPSAERFYRPLSLFMLGFLKVDRLFLEGHK